MTGLDLIVCLSISILHFLFTLGLTFPLCHWVLDCLTDRPQAVRNDIRTSGAKTVSAGTPQGCVLSPLLYILFTYDCTPSQSNTSIINDTTVIGQISGGQEVAYGWFRWCLGARKIISP